MLELLHGIFFNNCFDWLSVAWQLAGSGLEHGSFLNNDISQDS